MQNIIAVVVTYNRKKLLTECLEAIFGQSIKVSKIIVIDNNSTDNTYDYLKQKNLLKDELLYYKLKENIGGAGGFYEGIKKSQMFNPSWVWIMDDDTIPTQNCLKELIENKNKIAGKISYLASTVYGANGEFMNVPSINLSKSESLYPDWYRYLKDGIVKIKEATFVSLLINNDAIKKVGYPVKDYFIWGDDIEYTLRLNEYYGPSYFVGSSVAIHKRKIAKSLSLIEETDLNRLRFHYFMIRNNLINKKNYYGTKACLKFLLYEEKEALKILFDFRCKYKIKKILVIQKGIFCFLLKKYDYNAFKNRFDLNVIYKK